METDEASPMECESWPLHDAAASGDCNTITQLIMYGCNPDQLDNMSNTPLHVAVSKNQLPAVRLLLQQSGCDVNMVNSKNQTPLLLAAVLGFYHAVDMLLDHGADINRRDRDEHDALYLAVLLNHPKTIQTILAKAGDRRFYRRQNVTKLPNMIFLAIAMELSCEYIESLLNYALVEELYEMNDSNNNILHHALLYKRRDVIRLIKTYCNDINILIVGINLSGQSLLSICIEKSYFDVMLLLLPNEFDEIVHNILIRYIIEQNVERINELIENINIYEAIEYNFVIFIGVFLRYWLMHLNFDEIGPNGETPIKKAIRLRKVKAAAVLIQHGANVQMNDQELLKCQEIFEMPFYELLKEAGATNSQYMPSLSVIRNNLPRLQLEDFILKIYPLFCKPLNIDIFYDTIQYSYENIINHENSALSYAIMNNETYKGEIIRELLMNGANPKKIYENEQTLLIIACKYSNNISTINMLVAAAPDVVNTSDRYGMTALLYAAENIDSGYLKLLIAAGSDINHVDDNGDSALHRACVKGRHENIKMLLEHGANVRKQNNKSQTPLIAALTSVDNSISTINMLIDAAPDVVNISDRYGMTALLYAAENINSGHLKALIAAESDINHVNNNGDNVLHRACAKGGDENIRILLQHGVNVQQLNKKLQTPIMFAAANLEINNSTIDMLEF